MNHNIARAGLALALAGSFAIPAATAAQASGSSAVINTGNCSGTADWKLKAQPDNGRIELEFEVDANRAGQAWRVRIFHDGARIFSGTRTTMAPSGSFTVRRITANHAGPDHYRAVATRVSGGQTCRGTVTL